MGRFSMQPLTCGAMACTTGTDKVKKARLARSALLSEDRSVELRNAVAPRVNRKCLLQIEVISPGSLLLKC